MRRTFVAIASLAFSAVAHAEEYCPMTGGTAPIPEPVIGMEYRHIKPIMAEWGWEPVPQPVRPSILLEQAEFDEGFTEVEGCSGTDDTFPCNFLWRDEVGNDLQVLTRVLEFGSDKREVTALTLYCRDTDRYFSHIFN